MSGPPHDGIPPFRVDVRSDGGRLTVSPVGDLDIGSAGRVEQALAGALSDGSGHVVLDLRGVTFLDSTGIGLLVAANERARTGGRRLSVILGGRATRMPLQVTGVAEHLDVIDG